MHVRRGSAIGDDRVEKVDDLLLTSRCGIELSAHLGEPLVDVLESLFNVLAKVSEVLPQVDEVLPHGVEACRGGAAEITDLAAELADVTISGSCEHPGGTRILRDRPHLSGQVANLILQS